MAANGLHQRFAQLEQDVKLLVGALKLRGAVNHEAASLDDEALRGILAAEERRIDTRMQVCPPAACDQAAWRILLAAYAAQEAGRVLSVTALGSFAHAPPTTALRWLSVLVTEGFLVSRPDETDRRRRHLAISSEGRSTLRAYASRIGRER